MPREEIRSVTPWEVRLMLDAAEGLTYREIALKRGRKVRTVERTFERMRDKLRPWGGGSKAGLVHWVDTHYQEWLDAQGLPVTDRDRRTG
jgi:hypothetical protein